LETSGEASGFFSCSALLKVDENLTCETEAKAMKEIKDDKLFYLEFFQYLKGELASAE
jgi:hypothetical protein